MSEMPTDELPTYHRYNYPQTYKRWVHLRALVHRGKVTVIPEWLDCQEAFLQHNHPYENFGLKMLRIDESLPYGPGNVCWRPSVLTPSIIETAVQQEYPRTCARWYFLDLNHRRGVWQVCAEWRDCFEAFFCDCCDHENDGAEMVRTDESQPWHPKNVRWQTPTMQQQSGTTIDQYRRLYVRWWKIMREWKAGRSVVVPRWSESFLNFVEDCREFNRPGFRLFRKDWAKPWGPENIIWRDERPQAGRNNEQGEERLRLRREASEQKRLERQRIRDERQFAAQAEKEERRRQSLSPFQRQYPKTFHRWTKIMEGEAIGSWGVTPSWKDFEAFMADCGIDERPGSRLERIDTTIPWKQSNVSWRNPLSEDLSEEPLGVVLPYNLDSLSRIPLEDSIPRLPEQLIRILGDRGLLFEVSHALAILACLDAREIELIRDVQEFPEGGDAEAFTAHVKQIAERYERVPLGEQNPTEIWRMAAAVRVQRDAYSSEEPTSDEYCTELNLPSQNRYLSLP